MLGKTFRANFLSGRIEPLEPVEYPEGTELLVTAKHASAANRWFKEPYNLFAPVREELGEESEATVDRRIARAVKAARVRK